MGGPIQGPGADDDAATDQATTDQAAADVAPATIGTGTGGVGPVTDAPYGEQRHGMFGVSGSGDTSGYGDLTREPWSQPGADRPYGSYFDDVVDAIIAAYPAAERGITKVVVDRDELTLEIDREHLVGVATALRNDPSLRFELLSGVSGVDYLSTVHRLHAVYHFMSMTYRRRVRVEVQVSLEDPHIPSVTKLYPTADWHERETYDMFGIVFDDHPGLTRILMPDDWGTHPQRKDYPLGGIPVQYKGATIRPPDERRSYK